VLFDVIVTSQVERLAHALNISFRKERANVHLKARRFHHCASQAPRVVLVVVPHMLRSVATPGKHSGESVDSGAAIERNAWTFRPPVGLANFQRLFGSNRDDCANTTIPRGAAFMKTSLVKALLLWLLLSTPRLFAQEIGEGLWGGYEGEWEHVSSQLIALAEATPAANFAWRPAEGVRSTSEVYMHLVVANFYMLDLAGQKAPAGFNRDMVKKITSKAEVIEWLKRHWMP
jgi:hypothetical protein